MRRRLINLAAGLSLVVFLAVVALWVRSYWVSDVVRGAWLAEDEVSVRSTIVVAGTYRGTVVVSGIRQQVDREGVPSGGDRRWRLAREAVIEVNRMNAAPRWERSRPARPYVSTGSALHRAGFLWFMGKGATGAGPAYESLAVGCPYWAMALVTALLPAMRIVQVCRARQRRRRSPFACPACGYDRRASPERCPECGTTAAVAVTPGDTLTDVGRA